MSAIELEWQKTSFGYRTSGQSTGNYMVKIPNEDQQNRNHWRPDLEYSDTPRKWMRIEDLGWTWRARRY